MTAALSVMAAVLFGSPIPPPHPVLADMLKEYRRYGLPLPPADAELVRVTMFGTKSKEPFYDVAFRLRPPAPGRESTYFVGDGRVQWYERDEVAPVAPTADAVHGVNLWWPDGLPFAAQCADRGWHDLARAA